MILTAIVITMGIAAFVLALTYRSYRLNTEEEVDDDIEDTRVALTRRRPGSEDAPVTRNASDTDEPDELDALPGHEGSR
jgi:multicomponent Na+:H+ antiporter subunit C